MTSAPEPPATPRVVSDHAAERYVERHATGVDGALMTVAAAKQFLTRAICDAQFVGHEDDRKETWKIVADVFITVEDGEVKTVHPQGSRPKMRVASKRVRRK